MSLLHLSSGPALRGVLLAVSVGLVADECRAAASRASLPVADEAIPDIPVEPARLTQGENVYTQGEAVLNGFTRNPRPLLDTEGRAYVVGGQMLSCTSPLSSSAAGKGRQKTYQVSTDGCTPLTAPEWASDGGRLPVTVTVGMPVMITDGKSRPYLSANDQVFVRQGKVYDCNMMPSLSVIELGSMNIRRMERMVLEAEQELPGCVDREQAHSEHVEAERVRSEQARLQRQAEAQEAKAVSDYERIRDTGVAILVLASLSFVSLTYRTLFQFFQNRDEAAPVRRRRQGVSQG